MDQRNGRTESEYHIREIKSEKDLIEIRESWNKLFNGKNAYSHFQSFEWLQLYIKYVFKDKSFICIYLLYRDNNLIAIAPFVKKRKYLFWEYRLCQENTQADYLDLIYDDLEPFELETFLKGILRTHCLSSIIIKKMPESSKTLFLMDKIINIKAYRISKDKCVQIRMYESFTEYSERLGKSTKKEIRSVENKIKKDFARIEVNILDSKALNTNIVEDLMNIYLTRRIVKFGKEIREINYFEFIKAYILQNKDAFVSLLRLNEKIVAFNIGFFSGNGRLEILITSFDSEYGRYQVGNYLLYNSLRQIIESGLVREKGITFYDLGLGDELYKIKYGGEYHYINEYYFCDNEILFRKKLLGMNLVKMGRILFKPLIQIINGELKRVGNIKVITKMAKETKNLKLGEGKRS